MFRRILIFITVLAGLLWIGSGAVLAAPDSQPKQHSSATTVTDPAIPLDELVLLLRPMTSEELTVESEAWFSLLKKTVFELNQAKLVVKRQNIIIEESSDKKEEEYHQEDTVKAEKVAGDKDKTLDHITEIQEERTGLVDRLNLVLGELTKKTGLTDDGKEQEEVLHYRHYIKSVGHIEVDVADTKSAWKTITRWLTSKEGGKRWSRHIAVFLSVLFGFWLLGVLLSKGVQKALVYSSGASVMLKKFIVSSVRRVIIFIGFLIGLSALEINVTPVLALIGATGFVVAFALQDTLSNFASGLMILFYKPFDVDDWVDVSGVVGKVKSMTLVTTTIMTPDNKLMVVPNNSIWGNIITNVTGSKTRRVDLEFGIGYEADIDQAQKVLEEIISGHELVLKDPAPVVHLHELADSSVNFICRPWVKTADYWPVYWDITREVKLRFDRQGISIPFPQRDVHLYNHSEQAGPPQASEDKQKPGGSSHQESDPPAMPDDPPVEDEERSS